MNCEICKVIQKLGLPKSTHELWLCTDKGMPRRRRRVAMVERRTRSTNRCRDSRGHNREAKPSSARAYAVSNKRNEAVKILNDLKTGSTRNASEIALMYVGLGEKDQAMKWLEKAYAEP